MTTVGLLTAVLRGETTPAAAWREVDVEAFCAEGLAHGVLPLVADRLRSEPAGAGDTLRARIIDEARLEAAGDLEREVELRAVVGALDAARVGPLLFKGAHLAYGVYARPDLRPRVDTDVLIPADESARRASHETLVSLGYESAAHVGGDFVMPQRTYVKRRQGRAVHAVDLHWRVANPQAFARMLTYDELATEAAPLPGLSPVARGPSPRHALVIACVHRVAHHAGASCLIWLYDIDRLARQLDDEDWNLVVRITTERRMASVCRASLAESVRTFATPVPADVLAALDRAASAGPDEASARYVEGLPGSVQGALTDLTATSSLRDRFRIAREHLLPPPSYMREVYAPGSRAPLPWLYARRVLKGVRKWRRPGTARSRPDS
jgi:hypothetical protein